MTQMRIALRREVTDNPAVNAVIGVSLFVLAMALGAYVRIPVPGSPVPITLQTFFVLLSGAFLGRRLGAASQLGYIALGAMGLPIFQGYAFGLAHIFGPTGGYLAGFVIAAAFIGSVTKKETLTPGQTIAAFAIADAIIHISGALWLFYTYRFGVTNAFSVGILPFIPGEIVKIAFAVSIYRVFRPRAREIFPA